MLLCGRNAGEPFYRIVSPRRTKFRLSVPTTHDWLKTVRPMENNHLPTNLPPGGFENNALHRGNHFATLTGNDIAKRRTLAFSVLIFRPFLAYDTLLSTPYRWKNGCRCLFQPEHFHCDLDILSPISTKRMLIASNERVLFLQRL
jgi:hypothetical protein